MPAINAFVDVRLPVDVERGARGGPEFNTTILALSSGAEKRNANWSQQRGSWDISYGIQNQSTLDGVIAFFYARFGKAVGFRFKDWSDYRIINQGLLTAAGGETTIQVFKRYTSDVYYYDRIIKKIVAGTYTLKLNGGTMVEGPGAGKFQLNKDTGLITLGTAATAGQQYAITTEFDVPVRFDTDKLDITAEVYDVASIGSIPIVELKL